MSAVAENSAPATKAPATEGAAAVPAAKKPAEEASWFGCCGGERKVCISFCFYNLVLLIIMMLLKCVLCGVALLSLAVVSVCVCVDLRSFCVLFALCSDCFW